MFRQLHRFTLWENVLRHKIIFAEKLRSKLVRVYLTKEVKNTVSWINVIEDLHDREIIGTFYENQLQLRIGVELFINKKR